jgi:hypothetical protein
MLLHFADHFWSPQDEKLYALLATDELTSQVNTEPSRCNSHCRDQCLLVDKLTLC